MQSHCELSVLTDLLEQNCYVGSELQLNNNPSVHWAGRLRKMKLTNVFEHFNRIRYHSFTFTTGPWSIITDFSNISVFYQPFPLLDDGFVMVSTETEIS